MNDQKRYLKEKERFYQINILIFFNFLSFKGGMNRINTLMQKHKEMHEKWEEQKKAENEEEIRECSFKPTITVCDFYAFHFKNISYII